MGREALVSVETAHSLLLLRSYLVHCGHRLVTFSLVHGCVVVSALALRDAFEIHLEVGIQLFLLSQTFLFQRALILLRGQLNRRRDLDIREFDGLALRLQAFRRLLVGRKFRFRRFNTARLGYGLSLR